MKKTFDEWKQTQTLFCSEGDEVTQYQQYCQVIDSFQPQLDVGKPLTSDVIERMVALRRESGKEFDEQQVRGWLGDTMLFCLIERGQTVNVEQVLLSNLDSMLNYEFVSMPNEAAGQNMPRFREKTKET